MVQSLIAYRGFIWSRAVADVRNRYAGTGLGVSWNVLHPLASIAIYSVVFTNLMRPTLDVDRGVLTYAFYLCSGFFPWIAFAECLQRGATSFVTNANYLKKLPLPEHVFVAQIAASSALTLGISFALLLVLALVVGWVPTPLWLLLPFPLFALVALGFAFGLLLGTLNVFFRDVAQWIAAWLPALMWTAPIVYPAQLVTEWLDPRFYALHPLVPAIWAVRDLFVFDRMPPLWAWAGMVAWPLAVVVVARLAVRRLRHEIRDVL